MKKIPFLLLTKSIGCGINLMGVVNPSKAQKLAYRFFSEPRTGKLTADRLPAILSSAERQQFLFGQQPFNAFVWKGNHDVILLVHGWESNAARWEKLLPYLRKSGKTIVAIDAPAHGLSPGREFTVPTYSEFINIAARHFRPSSIIGHSIGGTAALYYQHRFQNPEIKKMITLGAPSELQVIVNQYTRLLGLSPRTSALLDRYFPEHFDIRIADFSSHLFARSIGVQGLIIHDLDDTVVSFAEAQKIADSWKNAGFVQTKGLGHSMHDEALYQQIADFLEA
ncbi:alpha/beta hydrolase [Flavobacterium magnum]|uniref:Alpha/beta hydrolase n=1 Tax=Flavobacterium magnum TaxID=2162713 RepID=A0A2S0RF48_9FLAO|nr:alpha/beta fold hydrolase [Flavobacterium magnum]AWA29858.1 alpha/beta hydrolase [Flavobacterium magnum]